MKKKLWAVLIVLLFWVLLVFSARAEAQHRYLGETGARVLQCARFYSSLEAQLHCVRGDELRAGQLERLGMLDSLSSDRLVRPASGQYGGHYGGNFGYDGGDGYFYPTDHYGRPIGTREKIVISGAIGATLGAGVGAIVGRGGTGALLGAGGGAIIGAISSSKASKRAKEEEKVRQQEQEQEVSRQVAQQAMAAQARTEQAEAASKEQKLLRNRFDANVRLYFRSDDGQIEELVLDPGQITRITLLRGSELIIAEVETETGGWTRLEYGSGKIKLPRNSGWEFDPGSPSS